LRKEEDAESRVTDPRRKRRSLENNVGKKDCKETPLVPGPGPRGKAQQLLQTGAG